MSDFTKGDFSVAGPAGEKGFPDKYTSVVAFGADEAGVISVCRLDDWPYARKEQNANAELIAAAFTAATCAEAMGYHGARALEALPDLLRAAELRESLRQQGLLCAGRQLIDDEREAGPSALAQARKGD